MLGKFRREEAWLVGAGGLGLIVALGVACASNSTSGTGGSGGSGGSGSTTSGATTSTSSTGSGGVSGCTADPSTATNTAAVVEAANAFIASLTAEQQTTVMYEKTLANAAQWSNFPTTFVARNGVRIGDMSTDAAAAAVALAGVAAGPTGAKLLDELREADEWLVTDGNASSTDYRRGLYYFSIHGTPSTSSAWMLQIAGHHLAYNFMYGGACTSATPLFDGAEPMDWTDGGTTHAPLGDQRSRMVALLASVGSLDGAKLSGTFGDLINGPAGGGPGGGGGGDTKYPSGLTYPTGSTGRGAAVSAMTTAQKDLVKAAIEAWVNNVADGVATPLLAAYESDEALAETYVGWSGSSDLSSAASYVRIDGPRVWIEASVQGGIVYKNIVHWHTIFRDKVADYGAEFVSQ